MSAAEREPLDPTGPWFEPPHPCLILAGDYDTPLRPDRAAEFTIYARDSESCATEWITASVDDVIDVGEVR